MNPASFSFFHFVTLSSHFPTRENGPRELLRKSTATSALDLSAATAEDPPKNSSLVNNPSPSAFVSDQPIAPDQFDPKWETDKYEIWSYYAYHIGNNGLTLFNFAPTAFQNLLFQAAGDASVLRFAGRWVL